MLNISKNEIKAEGGKALAVGLRGNQVMTELNIDSNNLSSYGKDMSGVTAVANTISGMGTLYKLILKDNRLATAEAGEALGEALKGNTVLKELDISGNYWDDTAYGLGKGDGPGFAKGMSKWLSGNGVLTSLDISDNTIGAYHDGNKWVSTPEGSCLSSNATSYMPLLY
jgi:hypothetical protein